MAQRGSRIEITRLTKAFGPVRAVDDLSFTVEPGLVTGFLGPNGAGKTTTLRCLLGLIEPTSGTATIGGLRYRDLPDPLGTVGAVLEASSFHPGRTARAHLEVMALGAGIPRDRATAMLAQVGLSEVAGKRVGGFSLGMRQRLGLAAALLGDPQVLVLDEPANGLDPAGIAWLRDFLRSLAAQGRTVLISSHVLSEVQQTVDEAVVISQGRLVKQGRLSDFDAERPDVLVRAPDPAGLLAALASERLQVQGPDPAGRVRVRHSTPEQVGHLAHVHGVELHELTAEAGQLERTFLELTSGYRTDDVTGEQAS